MNKRFISLSVIIMIILSSFGVTAFADTSFTDLDSAHWAHFYVDYLVNAGTINGYEDGSFRPDNTVTRAEFAKMMGVGDTYRNDFDYPDVPKDHWAYEYVMTADFGEVNLRFEPDTPITRLDTLKLMWNRQGAPNDYTAPSIITNQATDTTNKQMVAWAYATNLMAGNDGVHLRLEDTVSRAEAAVLIYKSQNLDLSKEYNFVDTVSDDLLENMFEQSNLFDDNTYSADRTFTYGEIARAAMRIALCEYDPFFYEGYSNVAPFEHEYAVDHNILCSIMWGEENSTAEFIDKTADRLSAYAAFSYAALKKYTGTIVVSTDKSTYKDVTTVPNNTYASYISELYKKGVMFYADDTLRPDETLTARDIAALLLQINDYLPIGKSITTNINSNGDYVMNDVKISTNPETYPVNSNDYAVIYAEIPNEVYEYPFSAGSEDVQYKLPKSEYSVGVDFLELFANQMSKITTYAKTTHNADVEFKIYPNLVYDNGSGFSIRVLCTVNSNPNNITATDLLMDSKLITKNDNVLNAGDSFFVEVQMGYAIMF